MTHLYLYQRYANLAGRDLFKSKALCDRIGNPYSSLTLTKRTYYYVQKTGNPKITFNTVGSVDNHYNMLHLFILRKIVVNSEKLGIFAGKIL